MASDDKIILWGREFTRVPDGLDERQVKAYVDGLLSKLNGEQGTPHSYSASLDRLAEQTVLEAEKLANQLREEARQIRVQAQVEAERLITEARGSAKEQGDAIARVATRASEEAQTILQAARDRGLAIERQALQRAHELMGLAKRQLETQIKRDVRGASEKLLSYVNDISKEVKSLSLSLEGWDATAVEEAEVSLEPIEVVAPPAPHIEEPRQPSAEVAPPVESPPQAPPAEPSPPVQPAPPTPTADEPQADPQPAPIAPVSSSPGDAPPTPAASPAPEPVTTSGEQAVQDGSLQLVIRAPVNLAALGEIYERLVQLEDVTLRDTRRSDDGSYVINLTLGGPTPLLDILGHLENVDGASTQDDEGADGTPSSEGAVTRIIIKLK